MKRRTSPRRHRSPRRGPSRRALLGGLGAGLGAGVGLRAGLGASALAAPADPAARKFLFVFVRGGWDPAWALAHTEGEGVYRPPDGDLVEVGGLAFVDHPDHAEVGDFFSRWSDRCALLHGVEVRSVTHEACRRIMFTGGTSATADDWAAIIAGAEAAAGAEPWNLPDLVLSGPAFSSRYGSAVIRVGPDGQLDRLLSGEALTRSDVPLEGLSASAEEAVDAWLRERQAAFAAAAGSPAEARFAAAQGQALDQRALVSELRDQLDLAVEDDGWTYVSERVDPALRAFSLGASRCAVVAHDGEWDTGWDTHSGIAAQSDHFRTLFVDLDEIMEALSATPGPAGGFLVDEVTVVVFSEMGRAPQLNALGGKDHWTFTSVLLMGAGVRGGQTVGAYDAALMGEPVDLETGAADPDGRALTAGDLGATLLALADLDPAEHAPGGEVITALISD